jgi:hypothetical protein
LTLLGLILAPGLGAIGAEGCLVFTV